MKLKYLILLSFFLIQCVRDPKLSQKPSDPASLGFAFICEPVKGANPNDPAHTLFLLFKDSKVKIADLKNCGEVDRAEWSQYGIPEAALAAWGGWWAGAGDYFYVEKEKEEFKVYQTSLDEANAGEPVPVIVYGWRED